MLNYHQPVYRPPSEAQSLILQVTRGCSHNRCKFCYMYRDKVFSVRKWPEVKSDIDTAAAAWPDTRRIFLADGDAFVLDTDKLNRILIYLNRSFPQLQRVTAYASPGNLLKKSVEEMKELRRNKLSILYYGIETGAPELLQRIDKGATPEEMEEGCRKVGKAGLKLSITVILGLAGRKNSLRHARETAALLNRIGPRYLSALTLMLGPFQDAYRREMGDDFEFNSPLDDIAELGEMIKNLHTDKCIFRSNHASNYLALKGTLLKDQASLLETIERALERPDRYLRSEWMRGL